jgi:hypothetical protein
MGWLTGWTKRRKIIVSNEYIDSNLTDFPLLVHIDNDIRLPGAMENGEDVRFTSDDGTTLLSHETEQHVNVVNQTTGRYWVKTDLSSSKRTIIYMYYGNGEASDASTTDTWDSNYSGVWHFKETTGNFADSTSNGNDAITVGSPYSTTGQVYNGIKTNGTGTQYAYVTDNATLDFGSGNFTVETWLYKEEGSSGYSNIAPFSKWNTGLSPGTNEWYFDTTTNGSNDYPSFYVEIGTTGYQVFWASDLSLFTWYHLTAVRNGTSLYLYVNGVLRDTQTGVSGSVNNVGRDLYWGRFNATPTLSFEGRLDESRISKGIARSAAYTKFSYYNQLNSNQISVSEEHDGIIQYNFGGYSPYFNFKINAEPRSPRIISAESSVDEDETYFDATKTTTTVTTAVLGDQYKVNATIEQYTPGGEDPVPTFTSSDTNVATVDSEGDVAHVNDGTTTIEGKASSNRYGSRTHSIDLTLGTTGGDEDIITTITPDTIDPAKHILVVYNTNEADSLTAKNYYLANRPEMGTANVLGVAPTTTDGFERMTPANYETQVRDPIVSELNTLAGSGKYIRYIVLMYGMPSRTSSGVGGYATAYPSVQYRLTRALEESGDRTGSVYQNAVNEFTVAEYQGMSALCTSFNVGTLADFQAYIDKLATMYGNMTSPDIIISATDASYGNIRYCFDDKSRAYSTQTCGNALNLLLAENGSATTLYGANSGDSNPVPDQTSHITSAADVASYMSWGANGGLGGSYANSGAIVFTGDSGWYIICTVESFNGRRSTGQGNMVDWFSSNAFGGTTYSNTPVFGVTHVEEPYLGGVNDGMFFALWERGWLGIEAAWQSRNVNKMQCIGDPLVKK